MNILTRETTAVHPHENGYLILVDKPREWTSFDAVNKVKNTLRRTFRLKKVKIGHGGTLDPLATGLLILGVGRGTKSLHELQGLDKRYTGTLCLGATTPSYDLETTPSEPMDVAHITLDEVRGAARDLEGEILQRPPDFSALKRGGKPVYLKARKGQATGLQPRSVLVQRFHIDQIQDGGIVHFDVACGTGTYIRSLAHDLGQALGCGAYLRSLRRTAVGPYALDEAWDIHELAAHLRTFGA